MKPKKAENMQYEKNLADIQEEQFVKDLSAAIHEWIRTGKPHKR